MNIRTQRHYADQWTAIDYDTYDGPESVIGSGSTEQEAIDDLLERAETLRQYKGRPSRKVKS